MLYAKVILPLQLDAMTYGFEPMEFEGIALGSSVVVELGARKIYEGIVCEISDEKPNFRTIKKLIKLSSPQPLVDENLLRLWRWIASYYMCTLGEVLRAALPSRLKNSAFSFDEFIKGQYKLPQQTLVALKDNQEISSRAKKQLETLAKIKEDLNAGHPTKKENYDSASLKALKEKGVIDLYNIDQSESFDTNFILPKLSEAQNNALEQIKGGFKDKNVVLLRGVTSSGKTEVYMNLISEVLSRGEDVLFLVPEIALTTQLISRLEKVFSSRTVAYHSRFTSNRRAEVYHRVAKGGGRLVVGARSSVFLPFKKLGLVIVDEEHDQSFKQSSPAPYYNGRDVAIVLASFHGCKTLLGSATPSVESYVNATGGKYAYVELNERYGGAELPKILISDTIRAVKRGERKGHFNKLLIDKISLALENKHQVILFQNRRGFSPYIECEECGESPVCPSCNVKLTLHKALGKLKCHYCGYQIYEPKTCPSCRSGKIKAMGFGTEKIENDLESLFPEARVSRLDADSCSTKGAFERIIDNFEKGRTDIMVGTQMITKGFDFSNVTLVGVLNADNMLNQPDFRASERAFAMMMQVAGRAGRGESAGEVVIQTSQIENPCFEAIVNNDYLSMAMGEIMLRESFSYPPFCRLISLELKSKNKQTLFQATHLLNQALRGVFTTRVLGPHLPVVDKVKDYYLMGFLIKIERKASFERAKTLLKDLIKVVDGLAVEVSVDVDPV